MEDYLEFKDYLCFGRDKIIIDLIKGDQLLFSDKIKGLYFITLERNIVVSREAIYSLDGKSKIIFNLENFRFEKTNLFKKYFRNNS